MGNSKDRKPNDGKGRIVMMHKKLEKLKRKNDRKYWKTGFGRHGREESLKIRRLNILAVFLLMMLWLTIPDNIKASVQVSGGKTMEEAVEVKPEQEYTTAEADGWFKITAPKDTKYIGAGYDRYTNLEKACINDGTELSWYDSLDYDDSHPLDNNAKILGEQTEYWNNIGIWANENDIKESEVYYFHFSSTKAPNCTFKIVCGGYSEERQTISLNQPYFRYMHISGTGASRAYKDYIYLYQFTAPKTGYCRLDIEGLSESGKETGVNFQVTYRDGQNIFESGDSAPDDGGRDYMGDMVFRIQQGMTYYINLMPMSGNTTVRCRIADTLASSVILNRTELVLQEGDEYRFEAQVLPEDTVLKSVSYTSSNPDVVDIKEEYISTDRLGTDVGCASISAVSAGTAIITCTVNDGSNVSTSCKVIVGDTAEDVASIKKISSKKAVIKKIQNIKTKSIKIKLGKLSGHDGYQIQYGVKKNFAGAKKIKKNSSSIVIKKLKKGKTYYVRARIYKKIGTKSYYGKWSARKTVKIKK